MLWSGARTDKANMLINHLLTCLLSIFLFCFWSTLITHFCPPFFPLSHINNMSLTLCVCVWPSLATSISKSGIFWYYLGYLGSMCSYMVYDCLCQHCWPCKTTHQMLTFNYRWSSDIVHIFPPNLLWNPSILPLWYCL